MNAVKKVLDNLVLKDGGHSNFEQGACLLEAASYVAGEPWSDHPKCVSPVLGAFGRRLNDLLSDEDRQKLIPFIPRLLNTSDDGQDEARQWLASDWAIRVATPRSLDAAGLTKHAAALRALPPIVDYATADAARVVARAARDDAWLLRKTAMDGLREQVKAEMVKRGLPAVAVAVAAADAVADAAADAVADAVAAAAADADAAADAVADAAAAAAAVADAAAAAVADADFRWGSNGYWAVRDAVYKAVRKQLDDTADERSAKFREVRRLNHEGAIDLLDRMIDPSAAAKA